MATATAYIFFPPVQPMRFTDPNKSIPQQFNLKHLDEYAQRNSLLPFQDDPNIATKVQFDDITWVQFHHNLYSYDVRIVDADGTVVYDTSGYAPIFRGSADFAGNVYDAHGTILPVPLHTATAKIAWKDLTLIDNRIYFIEIRIYTNALKTDWVTRISEPLYYKTKHYNTFRIDYAHVSNDFGVFWNYQDLSSIFNRWNITFQLRIDGYLEQLQMDGTDVFYTDQMTDLRQLNARPYRKQTLFIGSGYGTVDYQIEKVWRAFACSYTLVDGKRFGKEENAKIEITAKDQEAAKQAALLLREYWNADAGFVNGTYTVEEVAPGGWDPAPPFTPFMAFPTGKEVKLSESTSITDDASGTAYAEELTFTIWGGNPADLGVGEVLPYPFGLFGEFSYDTSAHTIAYIPDEADEFIPAFRIDSYSSTFNHTVSSADLSGGFYAFKFKGGSFVVDWGDGSDLETFEYTNTNGATQTASHEYPSGTLDFPIIIYHNDTGIEVIQLKSTALEITAIGGDVPSSLNTFYIELADFGTEFDFALLNPCAGNLQSITVKNCGITLITTTTWESGMWTGGFNYVDFSENGLDSVAMDVLLNDLVTYPTILANGVLDIRSQDPIDYVSTASDFARDTLIGFKWELLVDLP